jgi:hypothetical protein
MYFRAESTTAVIFGKADSHYPPLFITLAISFYVSDVVFKQGTFTSKQELMIDKISFVWGSTYKAVAQHAVVTRCLSNSTWADDGLSHLFASVYLTSSKEPQLPGLAVTHSGIPAG